MIEPAAADRSRTSQQPDRREPAASMTEWPMKFGSGESSQHTPCYPPPPSRYSGGFARSTSTSPTRLSDLARAHRTEHDFHSLDPTRSAASGLDGVKQ